MGIDYAPPLSRSFRPSGNYYKANDMVATITN